MRETLLGRPYEKKYVKGDVSIRDSLKKNASQRGLGSHRPHGTYQSRVKFRGRTPGTDNGKYSTVNRTIRLCNQQLQ